MHTNRKFAENVFATVQKNMSSYHYHDRWLDVCTRVIEGTLIEWDWTAPDNTAGFADCLRHRIYRIPVECREAFELSIDLTLDQFEQNLL